MTGRQLVATVATLAAGLSGLGVATLQATPAVSAPVLQIGAAHAEYGPTITGNDPIFILILGSDSRPGTALEDGLCDSIHILGIDPKTKRATLVGIPRDSYVPIASGGTNKINVALPQGGPEGMVATVEDLTGITFDYFMLTGFEGMTRIFDALGGLRIDVPYAFKGYENTDFTAGPTTMTGAEALEYSRTRKSLSHGDFDRSMNHGRIMLAAFSQFRAEFRRDPTALFRWIAAGMRNVSTDLPLDDLLALAFTSWEIRPARLTNLVAVGEIGTAGGASIVSLPSPHPVLEDIAADGFILPEDIPADAEPAG
ncbi:MAG: LytR family transcriptional regulator [Actinomycetia bacterium]|nr:LytR family transcriptional regulator [Actinomycetes bacterium]